MMGEMQKPSVGRIVHYMAYGSKDGTYPSIERAAIIAEVVHAGEDPQLWKVKLAVFNPQGIHFNESHFSEERKPGTWCWPART
jgi:hypothetical protein